MLFGVFPQPPIPNTQSRHFGCSVRPVQSVQSADEKDRLTCNPGRLTTQDCRKHTKIKAKLDYMLNNPVERRLAEKPGDWPWSSWHYYYREDCSLLAMDQI
jgi:hypothetical protein